MKRIKVSKELVAYTFWGAVAAAVNIGVFQILVLLGVDYRISNAIALVVNRFFCYYTNKVFVFKTKCASAWALIKEIVSFFLARMVSFFVDFLGVIIMTEALQVNELLSKLIVSFVVILTNYSFSKFIVFKKQKEDT